LIIFFDLKVLPYFESGTTSSAAHKTADVIGGHVTRTTSWTTTTTWMTTFVASVRRRPTTSKWTTFSSRRRRRLRLKLRQSRNRERLGVVLSQDLQVRVSLVRLII